MWAWKTRPEKILEEIENEARRGYVEPRKWLSPISGVGNTEEALKWLDKAYEEHSTWLIFMNEHASFNVLRGDPRFQQLLRKVGFKELKFLPETAFRLTLFVGSPKAHARSPERDRRDSWSFWSGYHAI